MTAGIDQHRLFDDVYVVKTRSGINRGCPIEDQTK